MPGFTDYFERIEEKTEEAYSVAREARRQGKDPEKKVDIPVAEDLAAKSEGLISASMHPELEDSGVQDRIRELEEEYGKNDERVALVIGKEIAENKFYEFEEFVDSIDAGLRVGLAYMTGGIVTAPLEGIADVKIKENGDGSEYLAVYYAGPIRSAGGTASAMSVLLADYIRKKVGLDRYKPSEEELNRYAVEVEDYFTRVTKKQYTPERKETKMIAENVPIEITGTPTENLEVSNHKDMDRIDTNRVRGGMALVYLDGLPLKASKIKKRIKNYGEEFDLMNWDWVWDYLELQKEIHSSDSDGEDEKEGEEKGYEPSDKFLGNIVAGRPVFSHQGKKGGFRLRYGRSRNAGLAACSFHPATLEVCQRFPAIGTQLKIEYPGKATVVMSCDSIKGPLVRLEDGSLVAPETKEEVEEIEDDIEEIVFVGDMLVPFGEFLENGKKLLPSPWVEEWWAGEVKEAMEEKDLEIDVDSFVNPPYRRPGFETAVEISEELGVPLHPEYVYLWDSVPEEELRELYNAVISADFGGEGPLEIDMKASDALEELFIPFEVSGDRAVIDSERGKALYRSVNGDTTIEEFEKDPKSAVEDNLGVRLRDPAPIFLGARMGRPEKAERRSLKGDPQLLFPCGKEEGGRMRNLMRSYNEYGEVKEEIIHNFCEKCNREVYFRYCPYCGEEASEKRKCTSCGERTDKESCPSCNSSTSRKGSTDIPVKELLNIAKRNLDMRRFPELLKSPRAVTGKHRHVEPIEKGLLRKKYDLYVNKDGTTRYDSTDLPLTHFKPEEIGTDVEKLRDLGYKKDINGDELKEEDQVLQLKPQDIIVSRNQMNYSGAEYLYKASGFVDELLEKFYGIDSFYDLDSPEEVVGELVIGLAPHTSGGVVGRVIGFTDAKGTYSHPYWHAAKRRNADGDEDSLILLMDALLNFSRQFLPDQRGSRTMDAPLILSTVLKPDEVDDESWNVDVQDRYSPEFYRATQQFLSPGEVEVDVAEDAIEEDDPFRSGYTHETSSIENGPIQSNYVTLGEMSDKVKTQLGLGSMIKAVDEDDVAELLLKKHFMSDIIGNLRAFSRQELRCVDCNRKYRRAPLHGECGSCGGDLLLTVSEGTIRKYLIPSEEIAENFNISTYRKQHLEIVKKSIQSLFGKAARQSDLGQFTSG